MAAAVGVPVKSCRFHLKWGQMFVITLIDKCMVNSVIYSGGTS